MTNHPNPDATTGEADAWRAGAAWGMRQGTDEIARLQAEVASLRLTLGGRTFSGSPIPDPIGCPCPGACAQVAEIGRLRAENEAYARGRAEAWAKAARFVRFYTGDEITAGIIDSWCVSPPENARASAAGTGDGAGGCEKHQQDVELFVEIEDNNGPQGSGCNAPPGPDHNSPEGGERWLNEPYNHNSASSSPLAGSNDDEAEAPRRSNQSFLRNGPEPRLSILWGAGPDTGSHPAGSICAVGHGRPEGDFMEDRQRVRGVQLAARREAADDLAGTATVFTRPDAQTIRESLGGAGLATRGIGGTRLRTACCGAGSGGRAEACDPPDTQDRRALTADAVMASGGQHSDSGEGGV